MQINPVRSSVAPGAPARGPDDRDPNGCVRSYAQISRGVPVVRVIEGELLDKNTDASTYDAARRWLLEHAARRGGADDVDLYARRAHLVIGAYLDTATLSGLQGAMRAGLDLYA